MASEEKRKEREDLAESYKEKKQERPFWQNIPPKYLLGGAVIIFFALRGMMQSPDNNGQFLVLIIMVAGLLYMLSGTYHPVEKLVSPVEAELLVEQELERKKKFGQIPEMCKYTIDVVNPITHRDARGMYYSIGVTLKPPYAIPKHFQAFVMMKGPERGFVGFVEAVARVTGREIRQEKTIMPEWIRRSRDYPLLDRMFSKYGGF